MDKTACRLNTSKYKILLGHIFLIYVYPLTFQFSTPIFSKIVNISQITINCLIIQSTNLSELLIIHYINITLLYKTHFLKFQHEHK